MATPTSTPNHSPYKASPYRDREGIPNPALPPQSSSTPSARRQLRFNDNSPAVTYNGRTVSQSSNTSETSTSQTNESPGVRARVGKLAFQAFKRAGGFNWAIGRTVSPELLKRTEADEKILETVSGTILIGDIALASDSVSSTTMAAHSQLNIPPPPLKQLLKLGVQPIAEWLATLLDASAETIEQGVYGLLVHGFSNIITHLEKRNQIEGMTIPVTLDDLIGFFVSAAVNHAPTFDSISEAERSLPGPERDAAIKDAFEKLSKYILKIAFPKGAHSLGFDRVLGFDLNAKAWPYIENPANFYTLYRLFFDEGLESAGWSKLLCDSPQGKILHNLCDPLAETIGKLIRDLSTNSTSTIPRNLQEFMGKVTSSSESSEAKELVEWMPNGVVQICFRPNKDRLWRLFEKAISNLLKKAIVTAITDTERRVSSTPIETIYHLVLPIFRSFIQEHLSHLKSHFTAEGENKYRGETGERKEYDAHFDQISQSLLKLFGFDNHTQLKALGMQKKVSSELPSWLGNLFEHIVTEQQPTSLAWINPKMSWERSQKTASEFWQNRTLFAITERLSAITTDALPKMITSPFDGQPDQNFAKLLATTFIQFICEHLPLSKYQMELTHWINAKITKCAEDHSGSIAHEILAELNRIAIPRLGELTPTKQAEIQALLANQLNRFMLERYPPSELATVTITLIGNEFTLPVDASTRFQGWLVSRFEQINPDSASIWHFLQTNLSVILFPILDKLFLDQHGNKQIYLLQMLANYFNSENAARIRKKYPKIKTLTEPDRNARIQKEFGELAAGLLDLADLPPHLEVFNLRTIIQEELAKLLFALYDRIQTTHDGISQQIPLALATSFYNEDRFLAEQGMDGHRGWLQANPARLSNEEARKLFDSAGITPIATALQGSFNTLLVPAVLTMARTWLSSPSAIQTLNSSFKLNLHPADIEPIHKVLQTLSAPELTEEQHPDAFRVWLCLEKVLQLALPTLFLQITKHPEIATPPEQGMPLDFVLSHILLKIFSIIDEEFATSREGRTFKSRMEAAAKLSDADRIETQRHLFLGAVNRLLSLAGTDVNNDAHPIHALPLPKAMRISLWNLLPTLIADFCAGAYDDIQKTLTLEEAGISTYAKEAARVFSRFSQLYLRHALATRATLITNLVPIALSKLNSIDHPSYKELHAQVSPYQERLKAFVADNGHQLANRQTPAINSAFQFTEDLMQVLITKMLANTSNTIVSIEMTPEGHNPAFMMRILTEMMQKADRHIKAVNRVTQQCKVSKPIKIPLGIMQTRMGSDLHPSMRIKVGATPAEKEALESKHFFEPLAHALLEISGLTAADMPVPATMQEAAFTQFKNLFPTLVQAIYRSISPIDDPTRVAGEPLLALEHLLMHNLRGVLRSFTEPTNVPTEELRLKEQEAKRAALPADDLVNTSGGLLRALGQWIPNAVWRAFRNIGAIEKLSAERIGRAFHAQLYRLPISELFKITVQSGVTALHPGTWGNNGVFNQEVEEKDQAGIVHMRYSQQLQFSFTPEAQASQQAKRIAQVAKTTHELYRVTEAIMNKGTMVAFSQWFETQWQALEKNLYYVIYKVFGQLAGPVYEFVKLLLNILCKLVGVGLAPLYLLFELFHRLHIKRKVQGFWSNVNLPIHESLIRTCLLHFVQSICEERRRIREGAPPPSPRSV